MALSDFIAGRFPAMGDGWAYMDNAGGTLTLDTVAADVAEYMQRCPVQLGGQYAASVEAAERLDEARARLARLFDVEAPGGVDPAEVVIGATTTQLLQRLAEAWRPRLAPGDRIVVTEADHAANLTPWQSLPVELDWWRVDPVTGRLDLDELESLLTPRTRLVCLTHVSNLLGRVHPIEAVVERAHARGVQVCVDGVAYAPHRAMTVKRWNVDYYVFSLYKTFGPHLALLYGRRERLLELGNVNHEFFGRDQLPARFEPGGYAYELAWGARRIVDYLQALGRLSDPGAPAERALALAFERIAREEAALTARFVTGLEAIPHARPLAGSFDEPEVQLPVFSLKLDGRDGRAIEATAAARRLALRSGHFYAPRLLRAMRVDPAAGVLRASLVHYNTQDEVDRLLGLLADVWT